MILRHICTPQRYGKGNARSLSFLKQMFTQKFKSPPSIHARSLTPITCSLLSDNSPSPRMYYRVQGHRESGGKEPAGFALVPEKVQVVRADFFQQFLLCGNRDEEDQQLQIRGWLERHMGVPLLEAHKGDKHYIGPLSWDS